MAYGTVNADVIGTSVSGSNLGAGNASIMKNRIINGAMVIDQRNAGASVTPDNAYTLDRWKYANTQTGKATVQQNAGSVTPPAGYQNYLGVTSASAYSVGASDLFVVLQNIEGYNMADFDWGTANAKTVTLSFWVRSSLTGTFGGTMNNSAGNRCYPFSYTINSANTWEQKSITVAGDTTGTWLKTNGNGMQLAFGLGCGSGYSGTAGAWSSTTYLSCTGATSVVGTNGATFYLTGVQLEVGSSATGFEYENYTSLLCKCQRYYAKLQSLTTYTSFGIGVAGSSTDCAVFMKYPVTMRSAPTVSYSGTSLSDNLNNITVNGINSTYAGTDTAGVAVNGTGMTQFRVYSWIAPNTTGYVAFSSEL